jgi:tetratricopeptide (TPR) repeat protein
MILARGARGSRSKDLSYSLRIRARAHQLSSALALHKQVPRAIAFGNQTTEGLPEANVQNAVTYVDRGIAKERTGDLDGALFDYNQAVKLDPKDARACNNRGNVKFRKGDLNGAMADFNQAIRLNPQFALAYNNRGNVKFRRGDLNGAMSDYNQAIQLNPQFALAYRNRRRAKEKKGDVNGAIADFNRAIKRGVTTDF